MKHSQGADRRRVGHLLSGAAAAAVLLGGGQALAQAASGDQTSASNTTIGQVVVTARRKNEVLQRVPEAISAVRPADIESHGVFSMVTVAQVAPGIHVDASGIGDRTDLVLTIRGQGQTYGTEYPSVLTYFNEVPLARLTTGQFFDLQNLQVLRGPQGTLFGKVTDGGAMLIVPNKPSDDFRASIEGKFGNYGLKDFEGMVNVPIVEDKVLFRGAFDIDRRNGFTYDRGITSAQAAGGAQDPNAGRWLDDVDYDSFRFSLVVRPNDKLENYSVLSYYTANENGTGAQLSALNAPLLSQTLTNAGLPAASLISLLNQEIAQNNAAGPRSTALSNYLESKRLNLIFTNTTTWQIDDNLTLKNIFGWVRNREYQPNDYDGSFLPLIDTDKPAFPLWNTHQFSEELQLQGRSFDRALTWQAGLYADLKEPAGPQENLVTELYNLERTQTMSNTDRSQAVYAQGTYDFSKWIEGLSLTGGLRYTIQENNSTTNEALIIPGVAAFCNVTTTTGGSTPAQAGDTVTPNGIVTANPAGCAFPFHDIEHALTYNVSLDYKLARDKIIYVASRRGFKGGGFNAAYAALDQAGYKPEYIQDVELGFKGDWQLPDDVKLRTNIALYRAKETDIQRLVNYTPPGSVSPDDFVSNAASAVVQGVEFEGVLAPIPGLNLTARWAYTDAAYDKVNIAQTCDASSTVPAFCPLNKLQDTPLNQVTLDAHYTLPLDRHYGAVTLGGNWVYQTAVALSDDSWFSAVKGVSGAPIQGAYGLLNFDATWTNFMSRPIDLSLFVTNATDEVYRIGVDDLSYAFGTVANIYGEPRMFGGSIKYRFGAGS
ncbi:MAG: TonB-dependent receptor plug domain-containing protein [Caulobacteraceae bacterium]|nr:TonB-dependent receptor plug domain-containing protein [Caulobacteraceae bacterium]